MDVDNTISYRCVFAIAYINTCSTPDDDVDDDDDDDINYNIYIVYTLHTLQTAIMYIYIQLRIYTQYTIYILLWVSTIPYV